MASSSVLSKFAIGFFRPAAARGLASSFARPFSFTPSGVRRDDAAAPASDAGYLNADEVRDRVLSVVRNFEKVAEDKVSAESHFVNDLGLDSLDSVELVMAFEDEFAIEIPDADADKIESCKDAVDYIANNPNSK